MYLPIEQNYTSQVVVQVRAAGDRLRARHGPAGRPWSRRCRC